MTERRYTLKEIGAMRVKIRKHVIKSYTEDDDWGGYSDQEVNAEAEEMLRTYLMAGVDPAEF